MEEQRLYTISQYFSNPAIVSNTIQNLGLIKEQFKNKYLNLLKSDKFKAIVYTNKNRIFVYVKVPSESYDTLFYDVLIEIDPTNKILEKNIFNVYSNCPSFVYTYAYVFNLYGLLIPEFKDKYSTKVLSEEPKIKNYFKIINYEKSIYYALSYILYKYDNDTEKMQKKAIKVDIDKLHNKILNYEEKMLQYSKVRKKYMYDKKHNAALAAIEVNKKEKRKNVRKETKQTTFATRNSKASKASKVKGSTRTLKAKRI